MILTLRTDKPDSEIGIYKGTEQIAYVTWPAHRQLAETLHRKLSDTLKQHTMVWADIDGIVVYRGPGSFTGLRIGLSVANALAASLTVPIIASGEEAWIQTGIARILNGESDSVALPEYGAPVHITQQKK